jgi:hypothetical protein
VPVLFGHCEVPWVPSQVECVSEWYLDIEWYPLRTHRRGYPLHWVIFPLIESFHNPSKSLPMTLRTLVSSRTNRTLSDTHYTEGYPWHWVIPITLSSNQWDTGRTDRPITLRDTSKFQPIGYSWHWVIPITLSSSQWDTGRTDWRIDACTPCPPFFGTSIVAKPTSTTTYLLTKC